MKERPIIFSGESVRAIIDGRKSQTRRVIKPQPTSNLPIIHSDCRYGAAGDLLWIREKWRLVHVNATLPIASFVDVQYADFGVHGNCATAAAQLSENETWTLGGTGDSFGRWRPSIHMPRWASRITLRVTDVRVERVQDITAGDALAEGITMPSGDETDNCGWHPCEEFRELWDRINARRPGCAWDANPWVWALTFEVVLVWHWSE